MALYEQIAGMPKVKRRQRLSALLEVQDPTPEQKHEMSVLRTAIHTRGWTPEWQKNKDESTKTPEAQPKLSPPPNPPPSTPTDPPIHVHVNVQSPPSPPGQGYIPSSPVGALVHLAEDVIHNVVSRPPKADDIATQIARQLHKEDQKSMSNKPESTGITIDANRLVKSVGALILAAGIVGVMVWQLGAAEFLNILLYIFLPVFGLLTVVGLVKYSVLELVWNMELQERVGIYLEEMRKKAQEPATARATA